MYDTSSEDGVSFAKELTSEDKGEFKMKKSRINKWNSILQRDSNLHCLGCSLIL